MKPTFIEYQLLTKQGIVSPRLRAGQAFRHPATASFLGEEEGGEESLPSWPLLLLAGAALFTMIGSK